MLDQILVFIVTLIATDFVFKWLKGKEKHGHRYPPSLPTLPLVGSLPFIRNYNNISRFFMEKAEELGPIFTFRVGSRLFLTLNNKSAIENAVVRNSANFCGRPDFFTETVINPKNKGIIFAKNVAQWKKDQQLVLTILKKFGFGVKSKMEAVILREVEAITEYLQNKRGEAFNPSELFFPATSNIILNMLFGRRREYALGLSEIAVQLHRFTYNFTMVFDVVPFLRFIPPYKKRMTESIDCMQKIFECVETELAKSMEDAAEPCFVRSYIEKMGENYNFEDLVYLVRDMGEGGTDTIANTIMWSLVAMANHPDVQKRLHTEIDAVLAGDQLPTLQDQTKLPYVEATIMEIYRWRTIAPLSLFHTSTRDSYLDGYFVPRGTSVFLNLNAVHHDPKTWKDPENFRPERFLDGDNNVTGKDQIIPFSTGRRSCLGEVMARAEMFLIFTSFVKQFLVLPPEGQDKICDESDVPDAGLLSPSPFKIRFVQRKRDP